MKTRKEFLGMTIGSLLAFPFLGSEKSPTAQSFGRELAFETSFQKLLRGREREFPILSRAAAFSRPAHSLRIGWLEEETHNGVATRVERDNFTQIVRYPYDAKPVEQGSFRLPSRAEEEKILTKFLDACEKIVVYGIPGSGYPVPVGVEPRSSCGGIRHFLGRKPTERDTIRLRPLRGPVLREWETAYGRVVREWLAEFSLEVIPAR